MSAPLLEVQNLKLYYPVKVKKNVLFSEKRYVKAVDDISFTVNQGETFGLVGESGCGKSTTGKVIVKLLRPTGGRVLFEGKDIFAPENKADLTTRIQIIFQDPYSSLDPRFTVGRCIAEPMVVHGVGTPKEREERVRHLMADVGLRPEHYTKFPHEFSGGQRQRIGVARALAVNPKFIVCDEPTSALDVSVQAQVIKLFNDLKKQLGLTYLFISHDLAMVKYVSDRVAVMYLGEIVEIAPSDQLYHNPQHPYTKTLLSAVQIPDPKVERSRKKMVIDTEIQSPVNLSEVGCRFASRCPWATESCKTKVTHLEEVAPGHFAACTMAAQHKEDME